MDMLAVIVSTASRRFVAIAPEMARVEALAQEIVSAANAGMVLKVEYRLLADSCIPDYVRVDGAGKLAVADCISVDFAMVGFTPTVPLEEPRVLAPPIRSSVLDLLYRVLDTRVEWFVIRVADEYFPSPPEC